VTRTRQRRRGRETARNGVTPSASILFAVNALAADPAVVRTNRSEPRQTNEWIAAALRAGESRLAACQPRADKEITQAEQRRAFAEREIGETRDEVM